MRINLLGRVELRTGDGGPVGLPGSRRTAVLTALAVELNRMVPVERLLDLVWEGAPPATARAALQGHVALVRRALEGTGLELLTRGAGYLLAGDPDTVDAHRFERLCAAAEQAGPERAIGLLQEALGLWRGPALDGCGSPTLRERAGRPWEAARLVAAERLAERLLAAGRESEALAHLTVAVEAQPLRESAAALLVTCLGRAGRTADAEAAYERARTALAGTGLAPGPLLAEAQLGLRRAALPTGAALPRATRGFVGRARELAWLDRTAQSAGARPVLVSGAAGVGKTSLVLSWGRQQAERFPDGRLYLDLRGFDEDRPAAPGALLADLLRALGVADEELPQRVEERSALLRWVLTDRRMLLVLDNAASYQQVEPLLPGAAGVLVVVTSRARLADLVAREAALPLPLEVPGHEEAVELLGRAAGPDRVRAEPEASARLVELCDRLPLALRVAGARLAARPGWSVADLAAEMSDEQGRLAALATGGSLGVAAALGLTRAALPPAAARLFGLLGLFPGAAVDARAAAALAGLPLPAARAALAVLDAAYLVREVSPGLFARHDLVRLYAAGVAAELPAKARESALDRLLDHYIAVTGRAADLLGRVAADAPQPEAEPGTDTGPEAGTEPGTEPGPEAEAEAGTGPRPGPQADPLGEHPGPPGPARAIEWFRREERTVAALVEAALTRGRDARAWRLAYGAGSLYYHDGRYLPQWEKVARLGLLAAERCGDLAAQVHLRTDIGITLDGQGRPEMLDWMRRTAAEAERVADPAVRDRCLTVVAGAVFAAGRPRDAVPIMERVVASCEAQGRPVLTARALDNLANCLCEAGDPERALALTARALDLIEDRPDDPLQGSFLSSRAATLHALGRREEAVEDSRRAIEVAERHDNIRLLLHQLDEIATVLGELGRPDEAAAAWQRAIELLMAQGRPADHLRQKLAVLGRV
ncbi:BTAD domain-containing putative transcriptional regulator [Kitasatospora sp. NPDC094015]|uniref:AfsR/SARP family transcriptional regulator n=1 Tax=Kitasatospora sp. NPDC094015 TaxID=3155205 RepID=UPI003318FA63